MSKTDEATEFVEDGEEPPKKKSKAPLLIGLVLFLLLGGGGFFAAYSGLAPSPLGGGGEKEDYAEEEEYEEGAAVASAPAFIPLDELIVPLAPGSKSKFLAITTQIEVDAKDVAAFEALRPRFLDVLNTFLRAVHLADLEEPSAMLRLRAQLLRRIRAVSEPAKPRDLLITSFVLQ